MKDADNWFALKDREESSRDAVHNTIASIASRNWAIEHRTSLREVGQPNGLSPNKRQNHHGLRQFVEWPDILYTHNMSE
jgi:hypothetical protein